MPKNIALLMLTVTIQLLRAMFDVGYCPPNTPPPVE
jgi:hypothetical protein